MSRDESHKLLVQARNVAQAAVAMGMFAGTTHDQAASEVVAEIERSSLRTTAEVLRTAAKAIDDYADRDTG